MSRKLLSFQTKVITFLMGLLGFAACSDAGEEPVEMYGTPSAQFIVKGSVVNNNNEPIQNIKAVLERIYKDREGNLQVYPFDSIQTDIKGDFEIRRYDLGFEKTAIRFDDFDGEANGSYQTKTDTIQFSQEDFVSEGTWKRTATKDMGKVVLKEKDETTEEPK